MFSTDSIGSNPGVPKAKWPGAFGLHTLLIGALAVLSTALLFWFDPTRYHLYPVCLFHRVTGWLCPGCGSLRALHQLLHGHFVTAFRFNPLLLISLLAAGGFMGRQALRYLRNQPSFRAVRPVWLWLWLALAVVFTIWRNIPGLPLSGLPQ
jgi:hypothetical protein